MVLCCSLHFVLFVTGLALSEVEKALDEVDSPVDFHEPPMKHRSELVTILLDFNLALIPCLPRFFFLHTMCFGCSFSAIVTLKLSLVFRKSCFFLQIVGFFFVSIQRCNATKILLLLFVVPLCLYFATL